MILSHEDPCSESLCRLRSRFTTVRIRYRIGSSASDTTGEQCVTFLFLFFVLFSKHPLGSRQHRAYNALCQVIYTTRNVSLSTWKVRHVIFLSPDAAAVRALIFEKTIFVRQLTLGKLIKFILLDYYQSSDNHRGIWLEDRN